MPIIFKNGAGVVEVDGVSSFTIGGGPQDRVRLEGLPSGLLEVRFRDDSGTVLIENRRGGDVLLNGRRLKTDFLRNGDSLKIGNVEMSVEKKGGKKKKDRGR